MSISGPLSSQHGTTSSNCHKQKLETSFFQHESKIEDSLWFFHDYGQVCMSIVELWEAIMGFIDHGVPSSSTWGLCHNYVILNTNLPLLPFVTSMNLLKKGSSWILVWWQYVLLFHQWNQFLDASSHLSKKVCPSIHPSVGPLLRPSVSHQLFLNSKNKEVSWIKLQKDQTCCFFPRIQEFL